MRELDAFNFLPTRPLDPAPVMDSRGDNRGSWGALVQPVVPCSLTDEVLGTVASTHALEHQGFTSPSNELLDLNFDPTL